MEYDQEWGMVHLTKLKSATPPPLRSPRLYLLLTPEELINPTLRLKSPG
jgi:hypothetical protein